MSRSNTLPIAPGDEVRLLIDIPSHHWQTGFIVTAKSLTDTGAIISRDSEEYAVSIRDIEQARKIVNGTAYSTRTPDSLIAVLEHCRNSGQRIKIHYGDRETGRDWNDPNLGRISRSTGRIKIPLVIHNTRSMGGPGLLDDAIVKITTSPTRPNNKPLWVHPKYHIQGGD